MDNQNIKERRRFKRFPFREDIIVDGTKMCSTMDISEGGLYISTIQVYDKQDVIEVTIPFKNEKITVKARVQHCQPGIGIGVRFIELDDKQREKIKEIISSFIKKPDKPQKQKSILIADDSEALLAYLPIVLQRMGYNKVILAKNGESALKLIKALKPDVLLLDIMMPQMDGVEVLRHVRNDKPVSSIPAIMLTTVADMEKYEECKQIGCFGYIAKPVKITELSDMLNRCITYAGGKQRKFLRTVLEKKVMVTYKGELQEHYGVSISEGGMYIRKVNPFPVGAEINIAIHLNDEELYLTGKVIHAISVREGTFHVVPGMTIEFKGLSSGNSAKLKDYIVSLLIGDILEEQEEPVTIDY
jgi:CheY-like chemotaxis protein